MLKEGEKVRFGFHNLRHRLASFLVRKGTDVKTGKRCPPQRRYDHAGNLRSQHERGLSCSAGRDAGGDDDAVKCGELRLSPRTESLVAAAVQWAERIMQKIDGHLSEIGLRSRFLLLDRP